MKQEEKEMVLKDLCARLPYSGFVQFEVDGQKTIKPLTFDFLSSTWYHTEFIKPYLRPMSSMTEEEKEELSEYLCEKVMSNKIGITIPPNPTQGKGIPFTWMGDCMEWLNEHHFDYRGLIEKGLALEAPEDMYNDRNV